VGKRTKLILGIVIGTVIVLSGVIFGLAKTGKISFKMLADCVGPTCGELTVTVTSNSTGNPVAAGVAVRVSRPNGEGLITRTTDVGGVARFGQIPAADWVARVPCDERYFSYDPVVSASANVSLRTCGDNNDENPSCSATVPCQTGFECISGHCRVRPGQIPKVYYGKVIDSTNNPIESQIKVSQIGKPDVNNSSTATWNSWLSGISNSIIANYEMSGLYAPGSPPNGKNIGTFSKAGYNSFSQEFAETCVLNTAKSVYLCPQEDLILYRADEVVTTIRGKVLNAQNNQGLQAVVGLEKDNGATPFFQIQTDSNGNYQIQLHESDFNKDSFYNYQKLFVYVKAFYQPPSGQRIISYYHNTNHNPNPLDQRELGVEINKPVGTYDNVNILIDPDNVGDGALIQGKVTDRDGNALSGVEIFGKKGGFNKPFKFNTEADFNPFDFNAITDSSGNYRMSIDGAQISSSGNNINLCAMVVKFPNDPEFKNWACYKDSTGNATIRLTRGLNLRDINIVIGDYSITGVDFDKFTLNGNIATTLGGSLGELYSHGLSAYCENCSKGPWNTFSSTDFDSGQTAHKKYYYQINDIYNISQQTSTIHSLLVKDLIAYHDEGDYYFDVNDNFINDDPLVVEILPSEIIAKSYIDEGRLWLTKDLLLRKIDEKKDLITVYGKITSDNQPVEGANVNIEPNNFPSSNGTSKKNLSPVDNVTSKEVNFNTYVANFEPEATEYEISIKPPENYQLVDPSQYKKTISKNDLIYDSQKSLYYYEINYQLKADEYYDYVIDFYKISQTFGGVSEPIADISKEQIFYNHLGCYYFDNTLNQCLEGATLDQNIKNRIHYKIKTSKYLMSRFLLFGFQTKNYIFADYRLPISHYSEPVKVYLSNSNVKLSIHCELINSVEVCIDNASKVFWDETMSERRQDIDKSTKIIKTMVDLARGNQNVKYPIIRLFDPTRIYNAAEQSTGTMNELNIGSTGATYVVSYDFMGRGSLIIKKDILIHEMSHTLDIMFPINLAQTKSFEQAASAARESNCDQFSCFSNYGIRTNPGELRAEFLKMYLTNNRIIKDAMEDDHIPIKCRNILKFLYQSMKTRFPSLATYQATSATSLNHKSIESRVAGVSTNSADSSELDAIMAENGYTRVETANYEPFKPLDQLDLTSEQIANGDWLMSTYNTKLPVSKKIGLQINFLQTSAKNLVASNKTVTVIRAALVGINNSIENLLKKLGINITNASISGKVSDQDGFVSGYAVVYSSKTDITDASGSFSISRVKSGAEKIQVKDTKTEKTYVPSPENINLTDNQQLRNLNLTINRPVYVLSGQTMFNNAPLRNGKIFIANGQTVTLDNDGRFNFSLKEGQYAITIKNKNNKAMSITNSGKYLFIGGKKLNVLGNIDSMIWAE